MDNESKTNSDVNRVTAFNLSTFYSKKDDSSLIQRAVEGKTLTEARPRVISEKGKVGWGWDEG